MIDTVLDFAIDHAEAFIAILVVVVVGTSLGLIWAYGRYHERATRRRGPELNGSELNRSPLR